MEDPRKRLLKNVTSNWAQMVVYAVIALFMTPFLVHSLGKDVYGIWALVFSIVGYTTFFDVGFRQSLARYLPKYYATRDYDRLNQVFNSSNLIYGISGTLIILATLAIAYFFVYLFEVPAELAGLMQTTLIIIGCSQALSFFLMAGTALGPFHRYDILNGVEITKTIVSTLIVVYFLKQGYGLLALAVITLSSNGVSLVVRRIFQQRLVPQLKYSVRFISKERIRELFNYGIVSFSIIIAWMVIFSTDNIVVGMFVSATAVTYYNIAGSIVNQLRAVAHAIGIPLVPAISHLDAASDLKEIADLHGKITRYLYYLTTSMCIGVFFFGDEFIYLWMGGEFTGTVEVLMILIVPACIYLPQMMSNSVLLGIGRHRVLFWIVAAEAVFNITLSLILVRSWGIHGVAVGTALPQLLIYSFVYPYVFHGIIKASVKQFYVNCSRAILTSVIFTLPIAILAHQYIVVEGWLSLIVDVVIVGMISLAGFGWKILENEERRKLLRFLFVRR